MTTESISMEDEAERTRRWDHDLVLLEDGLGIAADLMEKLTTGGYTVSKHIALKMVERAYEKMVKREYNSLSPDPDGNFVDRMWADSDLAIRIDLFLADVEERHPEFWKDCNKFLQSSEGIVIPLREMVLWGYDWRPKSSA